MKKIVFIRLVVCAVLVLAHTVKGYSGNIEIEAGEISSGEGMYYQYVDSADRKLRLGQWALAEEYIKKALREEPANPVNTLLFSNLGVAQSEQGKLKEAIQSFSLALTRAPRSSVILTHRCRVFLGLGDKGRAMEDLDSIISIDNRNEWALQTRGLMLIGRGSSKSETPRGEKYEDFHRLTQLFPENAWGWFGLGIEAEESGDDREALANFSKARSLDRSAEIAFRYAMLLLKNGELPQSIALLREALKENPTDGNLYAAMGWAHKAGYQQEEAAADLKLARQYGADIEIVKWVESKQVGPSD